MARPANPMVDTRTFGKVSSFSGSRTDWGDWKFQFCAFMAGANPTAAELLTGAETQKSAIDDNIVNARGQEVKAMSV